MASNSNWLDHASATSQSATDAGLFVNKFPGGPMTLYGEVPSSRGPVDPTMYDDVQDSACFPSSSYTSALSSGSASQTQAMDQPNRKRIAFGPDSFPNKRTQPAVSDHLAQWNNFLYDYYVKNGRRQPTHKQICSFRNLINVPESAIMKQFAHYIDMDNCSYLLKAADEPLGGYSHLETPAVQVDSRYTESIHPHGALGLQGAAMNTGNFTLELPLGHLDNFALGHLGNDSFETFSAGVPQADVAPFTNYHIEDGSHTKSIPITREEVEEYQSPNQVTAVAGAPTGVSQIPACVSLNGDLLAMIEFELTRRRANPCAAKCGMPQDGIYYCTLGCRQRFENPSGLRRHMKESYPQEFWFCETCANSAPIPQKFLFHRSDKIHAHLHASHAGWPRNEAIAACKVPYEVRMSGPQGCGFCDHGDFRSCEERWNHIIDHFKTDRKTLEHWSLQSQEDAASSEENTLLHPDFHTEAVSECNLDFGTDIEDDAASECQSDIGSDSDSNSSDDDSDDDNDNDDDDDDDNDNESEDEDDDDDDSPSSGRMEDQPEDPQSDDHDSDEGDPPGQAPAPDETGSHSVGGANQWSKVLRGSSRVNEASYSFLESSGEPGIDTVNRHVHNFHQIEVREQINHKGGTSSVFRTVATLPNAPEKSKVFALKQYKSQYRKLYDQELEVFIHLKHTPGVLKIISAFHGRNGNGSPTYNLLLEYAERDLNEYFSTVPPPKKPIDILQLWVDFSRVLTAIKHMHHGVNDNNLVVCCHHDLKPDNILIMRDADNRASWKIADFGFANIKHTKDLASKQFRGGTPAYLPPEADWRNMAAKTSPRTDPRKYDIWGLGCIFSEIAVWSMKGHQALKNYRSLRKMRHHKSLYQGADEKLVSSFHNGTHIAPAVRSLHGELRVSTRPGDILTGWILDLTEHSLLQVDPSLRISAKELDKRFDRLRQEAGSDYKGILRNLASSVDWNRVKAWLEHCCDHHMRCRREGFRTSGQFRLIDVSRKRVQVISAPISAELKYSALSYCWGSSKFLKLKKENLDDFESGKVNFAELPRTFTDAVEVTRKLGLQYIWIDALCIVQDDQTDWSLQASQMRDIYSNSVVTLAAISGMSSASGLFFDRAGGRHIEPTPLNLDHDLDHHRWHTRAWTFQEYVLSRRTIHFGAESIQWECQAPSFGVNKLHAQLTSSTNTLGNQLLSKARGMFLWAKIMLEYTNRELTFESDRLPAIAGVARLFHHQLGTYYCGLWEEEFPRHLLWFSDRSKHTSHHYRAVTWRAPSWSWASLSGPVKNHALQYFQDEIESHEQVSRPDQAYLLNVRAVEVRPHGEQSFVTVTTASLRLSGILHPIKCGAQLTRGQYALERWNGTTIGAAFWDVDEIVSREEPFWICPVLLREKSKTESWAVCNCLVLRAARSNRSEDLVLERVAMGRTTDFWRDGAVMQEFSLV